MLRQLAAAEPGRPALTYRDETLTRAEFLNRVERLAALFAGHGVTEGSTVTIGLPNSIGFVESMFAAWALGAVPQPISDRLPPLERAAIVDLADPALVVGAPPSGAGTRPVLESVPAQLPAGSSFTPGVSPEWKLMTSGGSTGRPKLIGATPARLVRVRRTGRRPGRPAPRWLRPDDRAARPQRPVRGHHLRDAAGQPRRADAAVRPGRDAAPGREALGDLDAPGADDDAQDLAAARGGPAGRRRVQPGGGVPPGRAVPGVAQAGLDRLARPGEGDRAVRRHRAPGRDGDQRHRMARAPGIGRPDGARRDRDTRPRRPPGPGRRGGRDLDAPGPGRRRRRTATSAPPRAAPPMAGNHSAISARWTRTATSISPTVSRT